MAAQGNMGEMAEHPGKITMKGHPLTLLGPELKIGDRAPEVVLANNDLEPVSLSSYKGKICIISSVPSLDTPVCDMETRRFNEEAAALGDDVSIINREHGSPFCTEKMVWGGGGR